MGYSYAYMGDANLPSNAVEAWLAESTEVALDWPEGWEMEGTADVAQVLGFLRDDDFSSATWESGVIRLRTLADKSGDAWLTYRSDLAIAFRLLAKHGGHGSLTIVGFDDGPEEGIRVEAHSNGSSSCVELSEDEVMDVRGGVPYQEVVAAAELGFEKLSQEHDEV